MCKFLFKFAATKGTSNKSLGKAFGDCFKSVMEKPAKIIKTFSNDNKEIKKIKKNHNRGNDFLYLLKQSEKETEMFCFLRHLRNVIAHGQLKEDDTETKFILEDIDYYDKKKLTAYGIISKDKISNVINSYLQIK